MCFLNVALSLNLRRHTRQMSAAQSTSTSSSACSFATASCAANSASRSSCTALAKTLEVIATFLMPFLPLPNPRITLPCFSSSGAASTGFVATAYNLLTPNLVADTDDCGEPLSPRPHPVFAPLFQTLPRLDLTRTL